MSKKTKGRGASRPRKTPEKLPDNVFQPVVRRLDGWLIYWREKWPHGVNPDRMTHPLAQQIGPTARAYKMGVRTQKLLDVMIEIEKYLLMIPGVDIEAFLKKREKEKAQDAQSKD